ncbi:hypothetical protein [Kribbella sp. VKM Ac-2568]|uniref:hypothetical protein n=1 Tax=Kribbella sp. VKM Ac-2568 TaxID=2512219 RepID=UPI001045E4CA|nr:hypothetical protein [Kribbella sp. VKM Ac-2568]
MSAIQSTDDDFRVCTISLDELAGLQTSAEQNGFSTRWTSVQALRRQVLNAPILLMTFLREERFEALRAYRCLLLFEAIVPKAEAALTNFDVAPERLAELPRLDRDADVRATLAHLIWTAYRAHDVVPKD